MEEYLKELKELIVYEYLYLATEMTLNAFFPKATRCRKYAAFNHKLQKRLKNQNSVNIKLLRKSFIRKEDRNKALDLHYKIVNTTSNTFKKTGCHVFV